MDQDLQNIIHSHFNELPKKVQQLILSPQLAQNLKDTALHYSLSPEQGETFEAEVMVVLLGLDSPDNFSTNVEKHAGIDSYTVSQLVDTTERMLFEPIRLELEQMMDIEEDGIDTFPNEQQGSASTPRREPEHLVRAEGRSKHAPDARSAERPISSSFIRKQVEKKKFDEYEREHPNIQKESPKPKPYWPDPYREPLDGK